MRPRFRLPALVALAVLGLGPVLGGCVVFRRATHESTSDTTSTVLATSTTAIATTTTTIAATTTLDTAVAIEQIGEVFRLFFGGAGSDVDAKVAALEDGQRYRSMLVDASANEQFQAMSTDIREVQLLDATACSARGEVSPCAFVVHDVLVGPAPALVAHESMAVEIDGEWHVAASAWCAVVDLGGEQCP
jgi:hypothetical protein